MTFEIEQVVVRANGRALKHRYTLEEAQTIVALEGAGSPKWIRWLAKYLPWIKVEKSLSEQIAEVLTEEIHKELLRTVEMPRPGE